MPKITTTQLLQSVGTVTECLNCQPGCDVRPKWFISYGALLWFIRDKNMGVPFRQDLDISIFKDSNLSVIERFLNEYGMEKKSEFLNDQTGEPFKMVFGASLDIDIFMQIEANGYFWHTYDYYGEFRKTPKKGYVFKGIPCEMFNGDVHKLSWEECIPEVNIPPNYGRLLDTWYENWFIPDRRFGQSKAVKIVELKNCKNLKKELK